MKALVVGASGFLGANLVRALLARGDAVRALVRATSRLQALDGLVARERALRVAGRLRD